MRVVLATMSEIGEYALEALVESAEVVALLTPQQRGNLYMDVMDMTGVAARHNVPLHRIDDINSKATEERIRALEPDVVFSLGWKQIVRERIFTIPPMGWIGGHPGRLLLAGETVDPTVCSAPGNEPMNHAILGGFHTTGMTLFWLKKKIDAGEVFARGEVAIDVEHETSRSLVRKIAELTRQLLRDNMQSLADGNPPRLAQELENTQPYMKPITADDNRIDLSAPAEETYRLIRSCIYPYPNAFIDFHGQRLYVQRARLADGTFTDLQLRVGGSPYAE